MDYKGKDAKPHFFTGSRSARHWILSGETVGKRQDRNNRNEEGKDAKNHLYLQGPILQKESSMRIERNFMGLYAGLKLG